MPATQPRTPMSMLVNLNIARKFLLLGLLAALAVVVPATLYWRAAAKELNDVTLESAGTPTMRGLYAAIKVTQEHRGLSAGALAGNVKAQAARPAKAQEAEQAIEAVTAP